MNYLVNLYRKIVPEKVRRGYNVAAKKAIISYKNKREIKKHKYGDLNSDKTFYVIRNDSTQLWGIGTTCAMVLNNIEYAVRRGWTPIVDCKNYFMQALQDTEKRGKENAWEYYFEQLDVNYSLEEVYKSRNVILGPLRGQPYGSISWGDADDIFDEKYSRYFDLCSEWIRIRPEIVAEAEKIRATFMAGKGNKKILGLNMRAGLYWGERMKNTDQGVYGFHKHPKGLSVDEYIELTYKYMDEFNCDYVFISCEDRYFFERMKEEFEGKCLYIERDLQRYFDFDGNPMSFPRDLEKFEIEMKNKSRVEHEKAYLMEIYLLSKCDSLLAVHGGGYLLAVMFNNRKYENVRIVNKGKID